MNRAYLCLLFVLALMLPAPAVSQTSLSITVGTNSQDYGLGQIVLVTVKVELSGAPVAHTPVYYELRDPRNQTIANGLMTTDDTGRYTKQIAIGNDFPLGSYTVYVTVTVGSQTASATASFQTIPEFPSYMVLVFTLGISVGILGAFGRRRPSRKQPFYHETWNVRAALVGRRVK
jgi:hypothetical protein